MKQEKFTLVELLVVIVVIVILAGMLLPALGSAKAKTKSMSCATNLKQIAVTAAMYTTDNQEWTPFTMDYDMSTGEKIGRWPTIFARSGYIQTTQWQSFTCPGDTYTLKSRKAVLTGEGYDKGYAINGEKTQSALLSSDLAASTTYSNNKTSKFKHASVLVAFLDYNSYKISPTDTDKTFFTDNETIWKYHLKIVNTVHADGSLQSYSRRLPGIRSYGKDSAGQYINGAMWRTNY